MHNYLLRYYLAEHGLDPDLDVQIRAVPPPEMVANLRADNIDGFLGPDPMNQRAVYDGVGFIHILTKDIWEGHPCCAFAASKEFVTAMPNTYGALLQHNLISPGAPLSLPAHPLPAYFAVASLLTLAVLLWLLRRGAPAGSMLATFCILRPLSKLSLEPLRAVPRPGALMLGIPATVLIVTCTVLAVMFLRRAGARTEGQARIGPKAARSI